MHERVNVQVDEFPLKFLWINVNEESLWKALWKKAKQIGKYNFV